MTFALPSTTSFGASYIELINADRAMTASSLNDSAYHSRNRSSGVRAVPSPPDDVTGVDDEEAVADGEDAAEEGAAAEDEDDELA